MATIMKTRNARTRPDPGWLADQLGEVKARIADLEERETEIRDALVKSGVDACDGELFRATVARHSQESVNWRAVVEGLKPSKELTRSIKRNTSSVERTCVKVSSR